MSLKPAMKIYQGNTTYAPDRVAKTGYVLDFDSKKLYLNGEPCGHKMDVPYYFRSNQNGSWYVVEPQMKVTRLAEAPVEQKAVEEASTEKVSAQWFWDKKFKSASIRGATTLTKLGMSIPVGLLNLPFAADDAHQGRLLKVSGWDGATFKQVGGNPKKQVVGSDGIFRPERDGTYELSLGISWYRPGENEPAYAPYLALLKNKTEVLDTSAISTDRCGKTMLQTSVELTSQDMIMAVLYDGSETHVEHLKLSPQGMSWHITYLE